MIQLCKQHNLKEPEFRLESGCFVLIFRRKAQAKKITLEVLLVNTIVGEMTRQELQDDMKLKDSEHFRKRYLLPALGNGLIEIPFQINPEVASKNTGLLKRSDFKVKR